MHKFNSLCKKLIESNTSSGVLGGPTTARTGYADNDTRPIEPAQIVIGAKKTKKKSKSSQQVVKVPIQRRPAIETVFLKGK